MNSIRFNEIIDRLPDNYGKTMSFEQREHLFKKLGNITELELEKIVEELISTSKFMPAISEVILLGRDAVKNSVTVIESTAHQCKKCWGSGIVSARMKGELTAPYAFRCPYCPVAVQMGLSLKIPIWHDGLKGQLELDKPAPKCRPEAASPTLIE